MTRPDLARALESEAAGLESQARALVARARTLRDAADALTIVSGGHAPQASPRPMGASRRPFQGRRLRAQVRD